MTHNSSKLLQWLQVYLGTFFLQWYARKIRSADSRTPFLQMHLQHFSLFWNCTNMEAGHKETLQSHKQSRCIAFLSALQYSACTLYLQVLSCRPLFHGGILHAEV